MKVVLAFDKFKGSATAQQLNDAARQALSDCEGLDVVCVPVADGGDGTTAVLAATRAGQWVTAPTMGPLLHLDPVSAQYFLCDDGTALIEVVAASGLALLPANQRDVVHATSLGTGMLMRDAMERGSRHIVLGLGGSATCDAAMGIMCALGAEFHDADGRYLFPNGESLDPADCARLPFHLVDRCEQPLVRRTGLCKDLCAAERGFPRAGRESGTRHAKRCPDCGK